MARSRERGVTGSPHHGGIHQPSAVTVTFYSQQAASSGYQTLSNLRSLSIRSRPFRSAPRCAPSDLEEEHVPNGDRFIASCRIHHFLFGEQLALKSGSCDPDTKVPPSHCPNRPMTGRQTDCPLNRSGSAIRCVTNLPSGLSSTGGSEAKRILARPTERGSYDWQSV